MDRRGRFSRARPSPRPWPWPGAAACRRHQARRTRRECRRHRRGGRELPAFQHRTAQNTLQGAAAAKSFAKANSIPFPVAVGNTWTYQTQAGGQTGRTTNRIVAAGPGSGGYRVTVSSTTDFGGSGSTVVPVYTFYPNGTIGYPVPPVSGVPVTGFDIRWPDAAGLASGKIYRSTLHIKGGDADVTVQGAGTTSVSVPAGTYRASVVKATITAQGQTIEVTVWIAQGTGPVKAEAVIRAPGGTDLTTNELLSFTKAVSVVGDGS